MKKHYLRDYTILFLIAASVILLDQVTKYLVRSNLAPAEMWAPWHWLLPYARVVNWQNTGAAFGILQQFGDVFKILPLLVSGAIIYFNSQVPSSEWPMRVALGLMLGGALGNVIDRFARGYVTDFISVGTFAVFNVADASVTVGVTILILYIWIQERRRPDAQEEPGVPPEAEPGTSPQTSPASEHDD